jgi:cell division transport system ATP-binding protein
VCAVLDLRELSFGYQETGELLAGISFQLERREILWVTGPPGSGKTTLARIIVGELEPRDGSGYLMGKELFGSTGLDRRRLRRVIGLIPQQDRLLPSLDVLRNVAAPLEIRGASKQQTVRRVHKALGRVGLIGKARCRIQQLSSSERRLLSLARVLAQDPFLVVADLNPGSPDSDVLVKHLGDAASFGSAVLALSQTRSGEGREYSLGDRDGAKQTSL